MPKDKKRSLAETHPEIAQEADGWDPSTVTSGSNRKFSWRCARGHAWSASMFVRTKRGTGCPFCAGQRTLTGFNDLKTLFPNLASQAIDWDPMTMSPNSHKKVLWKCHKGHQWQESPNQLTQRAKARKGNYSGCPYCSGRRVITGETDLATTHPEVASRLADPSVGQTIKKGSERKVEWICEAGHLFVKSPSEIGKTSGCPFCHGTKVLRDETDLQTFDPVIAKGLTNFDPREITWGSSKIGDWVCDLGHTWRTRISARTILKTGCPYCAGTKIWPGFNDLATQFPDLATQAFGWDPTKHSKSSKKKKRWVCPKGHRYEASIGDRAIKGSGCPFCSGNRVLIGFNDLGTTFPSLSLEADGWDPREVTAGSGINKNWKCSLGHNWKASPHSRATHGTGCPTCANSGFDPNSKGFLYFLEHPDWSLFQIGITNHPKRRMKSHTLLGWSIVELRGPMDGHLVQDWETAILRHIRKQGGKFADKIGIEPFDGYSESWLKESFSFGSLKEIMKDIDERAE